MITVVKGVFIYLPPTETIPGTKGEKKRKGRPRYEEVEDRTPVEEEFTPQDLVVTRNGGVEMSKDDLVTSVLTTRKDGSRKIPKN